MIGNKPTGGKIKNYFLQSFLLLGGKPISLCTEDPTKRKVSKEKTIFMHFDMEILIIDQDPIEQVGDIVHAFS